MAAKGRESKCKGISVYMSSESPFPEVYSLGAYSQRLFPSEAGEWVCVLQANKYGFP